MKRLFAVMVVLVMVSAAVYSAGPFFGAKLGVGIGFHGNGKYIDDSIDEAKAEVQSYGISLSVDEKSGASFVLSPYGGYYFTDKLAVQGEFNFMFGQKKTWEITIPGYSTEEIEGKYSSLDIPLLIRFDFITKPALFGALAGPYLSIPLGDIELSSDRYSIDLDSDGVTDGIAVGLYGGFPIGPGRIIGDVRFIIDFNPVKVKESGETLEVLKRRGINITAGYEILLGGKK
ncbi:PorT family protein [Treponema sp. TIM-1]|uniref:outer membrane beta-barrel protein n=1 Tax=Treponema sp. TIM-1 TaxID=2898417 RepID=UPI003980465D